MQLRWRTFYTRCAFWVTERKVDAFFADKDVFFILAMGRSGTTFLADLLSRVPDAAVFHEPVPEDMRANQRAYVDPDSSRSYIRSYRRKYMYTLLRGTDFDTYGEVNGRLRYQAGALKEFFPDSTLLHLVRDGRDVVRSLMSRDIYTPARPLRWTETPPKSDPYHERWQGMSRFQRLCWLWTESNRRIAAEVERCVRLEDILDSYEYFRSNVAEPVGLEVPEEVWRSAVESPKNSTTQHLIGRWPDWSRERMAKFLAICEDTMEQFGYTSDL